MSPFRIAIAFNRFGLGARADDSRAGRSPRAGSPASSTGSSRGPQPIAAAPARAEVAGGLADYLEEARLEGAPRRDRGSGRRRAGATASRQTAADGSGAGMDERARRPARSARRFIRRTVARALSGDGRRADQRRADHAGAVRRAAGPFLGQSFRRLGRQADRDRPRRPARVRGDPAARARPLRATCCSRSSSIRRCCSISIRPSRSARTAQARPRSPRAAAGSGAGSTRISPAKSSSCTRSASTAATARPTSPNSPGR